MKKAPPGGSVRAQVPARVIDLSLGGGLLVVAAALDVGAIHDFALDLSGETLWVQAEIRRCSPADRGGGHHVAIQFVGIDPRDERRLREYLSSRATSS